MAPLKGHIKKGGRVAGVKNKQPGPIKVIAKEILFDAFVYTGESLKRDIDQLTPAERVTFFLKAAVHFVPRLETIKHEETNSLVTQVRVIVLGGKSYPE